MSMGIDYNETFAPVPQLATFRIMLALAAAFDWEVRQGDVNSAFLSAEMDTEVWARIPNWFTTEPEVTAKGYIYRRVLKGVNGIPQGPRLFYRKLRAILQAAKMEQAKCEYTLYYDNSRKLYLLIWVDDLFLFYPKDADKHARELWSYLRKNLDLDEWYDIEDCLGCTITRDRAKRTVTLDQTSAVEKLLSKVGMENCEARDTPMTAGLKLSKESCPTIAEKATMVSDQKWYLSVVASLIYIMNWTRPDIAYALTNLCRFMHNPGKTHITALKHLLRYMKGTKGWGLRYEPRAGTAKQGVYGLYDSSHADCPDTRRSTMAYTFYYSGCLISWHTKLHSYVTLSSNHSEYCGAAKAAREAKWLTNLFSTIGLAKLALPVDLFSDSQGAIAMVYNPVYRSASKHVDLADHYVREQQERGEITVSYISTKDMTADALTKALGGQLFEKHRAMMVAEIRAFSFSNKLR